MLGITVTRRQVLAELTEPCEKAPTLVATVALFLVHSNVIVVDSPSQEFIDPCAAVPTMLTGLSSSLRRCRVRLSFWSPWTTSFGNGRSMRPCPCLGMTMA